MNLSVIQGIKKPRGDIATLPTEQLDHVYIVQLSGVCVKNFQRVMSGKVY
ncbi:hypothetical protein [Paenibacillus alginolyticus]|nr:hypothetical protein [Paenibacillus alginolyticus]MEC0143177.1 hypothetical protein [Paenibacillus alginolyticus]